MSEEGSTRRRKMRRQLTQPGVASTMPLYQQIKALVQTKITNGDWRIGAKLPTEHELVELLSVSRMTISRALNELTAEGVLRRKPGVGTFIAERPTHASLFEVRDIAEEIESRGHRHSSRVLALERMPATEFISERLSISYGIDVYYSKVLHLSNGTPVQLEERWVNPAVAPDYLKQDFQALTTHQYLANVAPTTELEQAVHAVLPRTAELDILEVTDTTPCLLIVRRAWSGRTVATTNRMVSPGNRHSLGGRLVAQT
jgi:GntR family transcriptional regulator, histidine utilization repressor